MPLTLKIISYNDQPYAEGQDVIINEQVATIGRSDTNTVVLPDDEKIISRKHATITYDNQQYTLTDSSLAGTFVNSSGELVNNASVSLVDGMQIRIGKYTLAMTIADQVPLITPEISANPFANDDIITTQDEGNHLLDTIGNNLSSGFPSEDIQQPDAGNLLTGLENDLFNQPEPQSPFEDNSLLQSVATIDKREENSLMSENFSSLNDSYIPADPLPSSPQAAHEEIPEDFNFEDFFKPEGESNSVPAEPDLLAAPALNSSPLNVASVQAEINSLPPLNSVPLVQPNSATTVNTDEQLLKAFLQGAQIANKEIDFTNPVEKMTRIGTMFRQFVESTVNVMRSRAEFKSLFRVSVTTIKKADNNPLKFSVTTDEALKHLIGDGQGGFKGSVESIDEGFSDLLNHQLAMQAGIQASLAEILRQFDPATIEKQYSEGLILQKKSKCWEKYNQVHAGLSETAIDDFFGDAFSEAYEQQMRALKK